MSGVLTTSPMGDNARRFMGCRSPTPTPTPCNPPQVWWPRGPDSGDFQETFATGGE